MVAVNTSASHDGYLDMHCAQLRGSELGRSELAEEFEGYLDEAEPGGLRLAAPPCIWRPSENSRCPRDLIRFI